MAEKPVTDSAPAVDAIDSRAGRLVDGISIGSEAGPVARLAFAYPTGVECEVALEGWNTLGRSFGNTIQVMFSQVSSSHCVIERRGYDYFLRDVGSKNGTWVMVGLEKHPLILSGEHLLKDGDVFWLASFRMKFLYKRP